MNKYLLNLSIVLLLVLAVSSVNAQTRTASVSGNWNNVATWGGASVPTSAMDVTINSGVTVTVTAAAQCATLSFLSTATVNTTVTINSGITLDVIGAITIPRASNNVNRIAVGAGTLNAASIAFTNGGGNVRHEITISTGTVNVSGSITQAGSTGSASITFTGAGLLQVGGTFLNTSNGTLTQSTGTVEFDGAGAQTTGDFDYTNLILSGSGAKTVTGATVNGRLSISGTATAAGTSPSYGGAAILEYSGTAAQTTGNTEFPAALGADLVINNAAGVTLNAGKTVNGSVTLALGTLVAGNNLTMGATGTPVLTRSEGSMTGNIQSGNDYDVTFTGNDKTTSGELSGSALRNVTVNLTAGQTLSLDQNRVPDGNLTVSAGTFNLSTFTINRSNAGGGTLTVSNGATLKIGGTNGLPVYNGHSIGSTSPFSTIEYAGTAQTAVVLNSFQSYGNLTLSGSGVKTLTAETVNGVLSIQGTATIGGVTPTYNAAAILEYKGSGAQNISNIEFAGTGANPTNVRIDNTNGVTLNAAKSINGALTLTNGYLTTTTGNLLTINNAGSASTANGAFVNGPLAKVKNTTAFFSFPVGTLTGGLRAIGIAPTATTLTTYRATFNSSNPRAITNGSNTGTLAQISACEYWDLVGALTARVTISWPAAVNSCGASGYVGNVASLVVARHNGTNWTNEGQQAGTSTGSPSAGGTIASNTTVTGSQFALATTNADENSLPVTFADVKAFQKNSGVQIEWSNLTEKDLVSYTVERSANGQNFTSINQQSARSNSNDKQSYTAFDASPLAGVNFYRVKTLEISGKILYSKVLKVDLSGKQQGISLYPNPVTGNQVSVSMNVKQGQYTVKVMNTAGQQVYTQRLNHQGGSMTQTVELPSSVKPGMYNMMITGDNYRESKMFIVQ